jgi:ubiquinone/menaquinone biosynthesis C-methylase UbiE
MENQYMISPQELTSNNIYDRIAETYTLSFETSYVQFLKNQLLERFTRPSDVCLDVGIANGIFSIPISQKVREVHGIDISPKMLEQCRFNLGRQGVKNVFIYERSAANLMFPKESFDVVFSYSTLLLIPRPERAYREIVHVLKPSGFAILDITGKYNLSRVYWTKYYRQQGHFGLNYYTLSEISSIFNSLGFEILERHATGLLEQWKYIKGLRRLTFMDRLIHRAPHQPDLDYKLSQIFSALANRWYFVLRKKR